MNVSFVDGWIIRETEHRPEEESSRATIFALANGYMGCRGAGEEVLANRPGEKGTYVGGLYDTPEGKLTEREIVNLPDWTYNELYIDGDRFDLSTGEVLFYRRELDMSKGVMTRLVEWRSPKGVEVALHTERFLSMTQTHVACQRSDLYATTGCEVRWIAGIDVDVNNRWARHFKDVEVERSTHRIAAIVRTFDPGYTIVVDVRVRRDREETFRLEPGQKASLAKIAIVHESRFTPEDPVGAARDTSLRFSDRCEERQAYEFLRQEHLRRWAELWKRSDVRIEGDDDAQMGIRFSLFHLLAAAPYHSDLVSIPARGLQGQDYYGSIFWDFEMFVLPLLTYTQPKAARNALGYRIHTLEGARRKAKSYGFEGAFYAWQSQETGDDQCALYVFKDPRNGEWIRSYFADEQIHISADIAYAIGQYLEATGDDGFLEHGGLEVLIEIARFFVSRAERNPETGRLEIRSVLGPDEYHERVDNNAYTSALAKLAVEQTVQILESPKTPQHRNTATPAELARFHEFVRDLYVPEPDPQTKLIEQFDGYFRLKDEPVEETNKRLAHPDLHKGGPLGPFQETQNIKQADVVMLLYLLRNRYDDETKRRNWEYYEPRTAHDSSLSPMAYSLVAADIGMLDWAYKYYIYTSHIDLEAYGPHWNLGIHAASLGGAWLAIVHGFCRLRLSADAVHLDQYPALPEKWREVEFGFVWHGNPMRLWTDGRCVRVANEGTEPVPVRTPDENTTIAPEQPWTKFYQT